MMAEQKRTSEPPLVRTKFYRPTVGKDVIPRDRLLEKLDQGWTAPLTLVSASAGYGKSTLFSQWLDSREEPSVWVSLDASDNDLVLFLGYFTTAVQMLFPEACRETQILLKAPDLPPTSVLAGSLDAIETSFILVLDDYHQVRKTEVNDLLNELLRHPPRAMHLALLTRSDPALIISLLRARGQVTEITSRDLCFSAAETAAFFSKSAKISIDEVTVTALHQKTEGWVTGLRLAALSLQSTEDLNRLMKGLDDGSYYINDYLISEVLEQQPPAFRTYLLETSILDRFCVSLCDALQPFEENQEELNGQAFIDWLENNNLFVIPLDDQRQWFRYHHLFQYLLQDELMRRKSSDEINRLHSRAGEWLERNGFIDEALQQKLAGKNVQSAIELVLRHRYEMMNTEQWGCLERWLDSLPVDSVARNPVLLSATSFLNDYRGRPSEVFKARDQAEALLSTLDPESSDFKAVEGEISVLNSLEAIVRGDGVRAFDYAERALMLLPPEAVHIKSYAVGFRAITSQTMGDLARGLADIDQTLGEITKPSGFYLARMMTFKCAAHMLEGDLVDLPKVTNRCLQLGTELDLPESIGYARYFLGIQSYLRNEEAEAERVLTKLIDEPFTARISYLLNGTFALALIHNSQGRVDIASKIIRSARDFAEERNNLFAQTLVRGFEIELALRQGEVYEARRLSAFTNFDPISPIWFFYVPQLTPIKLLLALGTPEGLDEANGMIEELDQYLRKNHRKTIRIDLLSLQARVLESLGEEVTSLEKLSEAIALAKPGKIVRTFLDYGTPMAALLEKLPKDNSVTQFATEILAAFKDQGGREARYASIPDGGLMTPSNAKPLINSLTNRELDVLDLVAQRYQNKEIAEKLFVSLETIRTHVKHICQKLEASNRREAVEKAKSLGLLERHQA